MKLVVLGLGSIGMRHARNFRALGVADIVGMDPVQERRSRFMAELGGTAVATLEEAVASRPTLAIVASPSSFHLPQALACAQAGIHLLIEKPLGTTTHGVAELAAAVEEHSLFAHVGSNWKFHPAFVTMKRLIEADDVGRIVAAQVLSGQWLPDWHPWEDYRRGYSARADLGGGVVLDSHEIDYVTWLLGPAVECKGFAVRTGSLEIETEDVAVACLRLECGALVTLQLDYIQRRARRGYNLTGMNGSIWWDSQDGVIRIVGAEGVRTVDVSAPDINDMYVEQAKHVLQGVRHHGLLPMTPIAQARRVLAVQLAILGSRGR